MLKKKKVFFVRNLCGSFIRNSITEYAQFFTHSTRITGMFSSSNTSMTVMYSFGKKYTPRKNAQTHRKITIRTKKCLKHLSNFIFFFVFHSECMSMKRIKYALNIDRKFVKVAYVVTSLPKIDILLSLLIAKPYSTVEKKAINLIEHANWFTDK